MTPTLCIFTIVANLKSPNFGVGRSYGIISAIICLCVMTCDAMSLTKQRLTPFKIKDLERGTYFKGNLMLYMIINISRVVYPRPSEQKYLYLLFSFNRWKHQSTRSSFKSFSIVRCVVYCMPTSKYN